MANVLLISKFQSLVQRNGRTAKEIERNRFICLREKVGIGDKTFRLLAREFKSPVHTGKNILPKLFGLRGKKTVQCRNIGNLRKFLCSAACQGRTALIF
jgi:hypothetical protein